MINEIENLLIETIINSLKENNYELNYDELKVNIETNKLKEITLKTSKPQKEGILEIIASKSIKEENIAKEQIQQITQLEDTVTIQVNKDKNQLLQNTTTNSIPVLEPTSKIEVETSKTQFSTVVENEEVEIKATLKQIQNTIVYIEIQL